MDALRRRGCDSTSGHLLSGACIHKSSSETCAVIVDSRMKRHCDSAECDRRFPRRLDHYLDVYKRQGVKKLGVRLGNWLTAEQGQALWQAPDRERLKGKRDRALLALLLACGLRPHELAELTFGHPQQREGHWAIVDLSGKGGHVRTIPVPDWVHGLLDDWTKTAGIDAGKLFRRVSSAGRAWGVAVTEKVVWHVVKEFAARTGVKKLAPSNLRSAAPRCERRIGADSISAGPRFGPDHRTLPRLYPADFIGGEPQDRNRAGTLNR